MLAHAEVVHFVEGGFCADDFDQLIYLGARPAVRGPGRAALPRWYGRLGILILIFDTRLSTRKVKQLFSTTLRSPILRIYSAFLSHPSEVRVFAFGILRGGRS